MPNGILQPAKSLVVESHWLATSDDITVLISAFDCWVMAAHEVSVCGDGRGSRLLLPLFCSSEIISI